MKKLISILVLLFVCSNFINPLLAQSAEDIKKEIHSKAMKEARKEAKKLKKEGFIVIGNESKGISKEVQSTINQAIYIPRNKKSKAESLNAAIACSIILAEFSR